MESDVTDDNCTVDDGAPPDSDLVTYLYIII